MFYWIVGAYCSEIRPVFDSLWKTSFIMSEVSSGHKLSTKSVNKRGNIMIKLTVFLSFLFELVDLKMILNLNWKHRLKLRTVLMDLCVSLFLAQSLNAMWSHFKGIIWLKLCIENGSNQDRSRQGHLTIKMKH